MLHWGIGQRGSTRTSVGQAAGRMVAPPDPHAREGRRPAGTPTLLVQTSDGPGAILLDEGSADPPPMDDQLRVALNNLRPGDWDAFEDFAGSFLLSDFPTLRPIAGTNDKGRDGVLFAPDPQHPSAVVLQYSLVEDWRSKILNTLTRLNEKDIPCAVLVYATSRHIGPDSDALEKELRERGIHLSMRDREWWVIRAGRDEITRHATEQIKALVLGRMLDTPSSAVDHDLSRGEVETGLFYLEMHLRDADRDRSLTRVAFEAFALASLRHTDADTRKARDDILDEVASEFPSNQRQRVDQLTLAALTRLKANRRVTVSVSDATYALHHNERQRLLNLAAQRTLDAEALDRDLADHLGQAAEALDYPEDTLKKSLIVGVLRRVFETIAVEFGNAFAEAVTHNSVDLPRAEVYDIVERLLINDARTLSMLEMKQLDTFNLLAEAATQTLLSPAPAVARYLQDLSELYTLRAFLREAPDVQKVVDKLFSRGQLVLDTTVVLPVFVETLLPEGQQNYTNLLKGAKSAGMSLFCTAGVFNEAARHLQNSLLCHRLGSSWRGPTPMVLDRWRSLRPQDDIRTFVEGFLGEEPERDVEDFLVQTLGVERQDLSPDVERTFDLATRSRITELWRARKRAATQELDLLLRHDVEMYLGVLALRKGQPTSVLGHEAWWVTLETNALALRGLAQKEGIDLRSDPVMHPNFLSHLLAIGPTRRKLTNDERHRLPFLLTEQTSPWAIPELADVASEIRQEYGGRPEYFLRRKLRERLNALKAGRGPLTEGEVAF